MKLLHTGDLHLGKTLHETSLLEDQKYLLDQLRRELGQDDYAALILAGDIYDRTVPPADAVELFSDFLVRLKSDFPDLAICMIPGNHDSSQRISYADRILGKQGIHIVSDPGQSFNPIIAAKNGEKLAFFLLPFLSAGTLKPEDSAPRGTNTAASPELDFSESRSTVLLGQAELAAEAARRLDIALDREDLAGIPAVLVAHFFARGGIEAGSERVFVGGSEQVNAALFSRFDYVALGHLHRRQRVSDRIQYAGAPLAYAFDESGSPKVFLKVDIDTKTPGFPVSVTEIPVNPFRKIARLSGMFSDFYTGNAHDGHAGDYLEISLTDKDLMPNPMNLLKPKFPFLLSLKQGTPFDGPDRSNRFESETAAGRAGEKRDAAADFRRFEELLYGTVDPVKTELFAQLLAECTDET